MPKDSVCLRIKEKVSGKSHIKGGIGIDASVVADYTAHLDAKHRLTLRGAKYEYYQVKEYENGCIVLEPRELVVPKEISKKTLAMMDESIRNYKVGQVSAPIDLTEF